MTKIRIIADGSGDLPLSYYQENDLYFISQGVQIDDESYVDHVTLQPKELFEQMRAGATAKTSQASAQQMLEVFYQVAKAGEHGIYLVLSSGLSGAYNTACMVKEQVLEEYPDFKMEVFDTRSASIGIGMMVMACVEKVKAGAGVAEVLATAEYYRVHLKHFITVDDLEYLARGGRIRKSAAFIGGMLNMKPIISLENGGLEPIDKVRGKKKLLAALMALAQKYGDCLENQTVGIVHADHLEFAQEIQANVEATFGTKKFFYGEFGGAIGAHVGPGTVALVFLDEFLE